MAPKLYGDTRSPCVRAVLLAAKALNVDIEFVQLDVINKEHLSEAYLKINPRHSVPALEDNGFVVWDSHAIMMYLGEKYGNDNSVYPRDINKRTIINQMLHFETGDIFAAHMSIAGLLLYKGIKEVPQERIECLEKGYGFLETFLNNSKFVAGNEITIADFSLWTTLSNSRYFVPIDGQKYLKITAWMKTMEKLPYSNLNNEGNTAFKKLVDMIKQK